MDEVKLLPCPFCGHEALIGETEDHIGTLWPTVRCSVCPAELAGHAEAKAIAAWNTRAIEATRPTEQGLG